MEDLPLEDDLMVSISSEAASFGASHVRSRSFGYQAGHDRDKTLTGESNNNDDRKGDAFDFPGVKDELDPTKPTYTAYSRFADISLGKRSH